MKDSLIKRGLLDEYDKLTQKGHEYVEEVKKKYIENTVPLPTYEEALADD